MDIRRKTKHHSNSRPNSNSNSNRHDPDPTRRAADLDRDALFSSQTTAQSGKPRSFHNSCTVLATEIEHWSGKRGATGSC